MGQPSPVDRHATVWERVREHKLIQWGIAYLGVALALAQGQESIARALEWPDVVGRMLVIALIAGLPLVLTLGWYHGHRGLQRISTGELTIISLLLLIGALLFSVSLRPEERSTAAASPPRATGADVAVVTPPPLVPATSEITPNSVAVLPFANLSPSSDDAAFAIGIHQQVLNQLSRINDLTSIARASVLRYADTNLSPQEIARELGVETIMTGTLRYVDGNVQIRTELVDGASGVQLWSEIYTRPFDNIFAIEADIATQVATALEAELAPDEQLKLVQRPTESTKRMNTTYARSPRFPIPAAGLGCRWKSPPSFTSTSIAPWRSTMSSRSPTPQRRGSTRIRWAVTCREAQG